MLSSIELLEKRLEESEDKMTTAMESGRQHLSVFIDQYLGELRLIKQDVRAIRELLEQEPKAWIS